MKTKLLIFGITGDLSKRKLLPAIHEIIESGAASDLEIIGVSRRTVNIAELLRDSVGERAQHNLFQIYEMDVAAASDYTKLKTFVSLQDDEQLLVYLSVPPRAATQIVDFLGEAGLNSANVKLLFEKPFGEDLASAEEIITRTARYYNESQLYRIDHYLAKEMAQNIVALRGGNALFRHVWNKDAIEKIEIRATETIGIEGRAQFYEQTGALKDVVQGHLMQLLALTLLELPHEIDWDELPKLRAHALQQLKPAHPEQAIRAQYDSYQAEVENPGSGTETFVSLMLESTDPRWENVPLQLITGKALKKKATEIRVYLRRTDEAQSNCIVFRVQPNEGVAINLFTKKPGYERAFETQQLSFNYAEHIELPDAYEQVIVDAIRSRKSLFTSSDEVLASWRTLQPLLNAWAMDTMPLMIYSKGTPTHSICRV